jgi:hypothetical protein
MKLPLWFVVALVLAAYSGAPNAGFVWDDHAIFERNGVLDNPTFDGVFLQDLWCCTPGNRTGYHRPLLTLTFLFDRSIAGITPAWPHVHSVLWHALTVALVSLVLRPRVGVPAANVAALIFGLHPIQSEAVLWISARNDLMVAAGVLATIAAADARRPGWTALFAAFACLSKESGYLLPVYLGAWRLAWGEAPRRSDLAILPAMGAALALRSNADLASIAFGHADGTFNLETARNTLATALSWVTLPWPLTTTASVYMATPGPLVWGAAVATVVLLVTVVAARPRSAALLLFSLIALAPSSMGVRWYGTLGERYLYLPLFGLVAALVSAAAPATPRPGSSPLLHLREGGPVALIIGTVAALVCLHVRAPDWATEETLFTAAVRRAPDSYAWNLLAVELGRQDRDAEAIRAFDQATVARPFNKRTCTHLIGVADRVLTDDDLRTFTATWAERGCGGHEGYDGRRALALAGRGLWSEAEAVAEAAVHNDDRRRDEIVRAAVDARDGDLDSLGARSLVWPGGASALLDQVTLLTNARH